MSIFANLVIMSLLSVFNPSTMTFSLHSSNIEAIAYNPIILALKIFIELMFFYYIITYHNKTGLQKSKERFKEFITQPFTTIAKVLSNQPSYQKQESKQL